MVRYRVIAVLMLSLLVISGILGIFALPSPASAASSTDTGMNWQNINYNLNGTNDSPQTAFSPSNVGRPRDELDGPDAVHRSHVGAGQRR